MVELVTLNTALPDLHTYNGFEVTVVVNGCTLITALSFAVQSDVKLLALQYTFFVPGVKPAV